MTAVGRPQLVQRTMGAHGVDRLPPEARCQQIGDIHAELKDKYDKLLTYRPRRVSLRSNVVSPCDGEAPEEEERITSVLSTTES